MYADDAVFFTKSAQTLQNMLDKLHSYSNKWGLKINIDKTRIMIFEKGFPSEAMHIYYNDIELEVVDSFKYLGIMFYKNGSWNRTQKCLTEYGSFALYNLYKLFQDKHLNVMKNSNVLIALKAQYSDTREKFGDSMERLISNGFTNNSAEVY